MVNHSESNGKQETIHISKASIVSHRDSFVRVFAKFSIRCLHTKPKYRTIWYVAARQMEFQPLPLSWFVGCSVSVAPSHVTECTRQRAGYWCRRDWSGSLTSDPLADVCPGWRLGMWGGCEVVSPCSLWPAFIYLPGFVLGLNVYGTPRAHRPLAHG